MRGVTKLVRQSRRPGQRKRRGKLRDDGDCGQGVQLVLDEGGGAGGGGGNEANNAYVSR